MKHILLVEDEEGIRRYLMLVLERIGYKITAFDNGAKALEFIKKSYSKMEEEIDLLITDNNMPGLTGLELIDKINALEFPLPSILITASDERQTVIEALRIGCYEFIDKPISPNDMVDAVNKVFKKVEKEKLLTGNSTNAHFKIDNIIGNYRLLEVLGEGTAGTVYLVKHTETNEKYALKTLKFDAFEEQLKELSIKRFINEGYAISQLNHPNIINFIEFSYGDTNSSPYIVMEYFQGTSLKQFIAEQKQLDLDSKISIICQIASALDVVHSRNISHRDIKPGNVLIDDDLNVKITDFGVCNLPSSDLTMTSELLGSPAYIAPEYLLEGKANRLVDIYSLGVVAYELFIGVRPFEADNFHELRHMIIAKHPLEPRKIIPDFPLEIQDILVKMMKKNPKKRYQHAKDIVADLKNFQKGEKYSFINNTISYLTKGREWS